METIQYEALRNTKVALDLDGLRQRYTDFDVNTGITVTFPGFEIDAYEKNFFNLIYNSSPTTFIPRWSRRPDYFSYDMYGTVIFWNLLLFLNRIDSIEDFTDLDTVIYCPYNAILNLVKDKVSTPPIPLGQPVVPKESNYFRAYPLDNREQQIIQARRNLNNFLGGTTLSSAIPTSSWNYTISGRKVNVFRFTLPAFSGADSEEIGIPGLPLQGELYSLYVITNLISYNVSLRSKSGITHPDLDEIYQVPTINTEYLKNDLNIYFKNNDTTGEGGSLQYYTPESGPQVPEYLILDITNNNPSTPCGGGFLELQLFVS